MVRSTRRAAPAMYIEPVAQTTAVAAGGVDCRPHRFVRGVHTNSPARGVATPPGCVQARLRGTEREASAAVVTTVSARRTRGDSTRATSFPRVTETTATSLAVPAVIRVSRTPDQGLDRRAGMRAVGDDERELPQHLSAAGQHRGFERGPCRRIVESAQCPRFRLRARARAPRLDHVPSRLTERDRDLPAREDDPAGRASAPGYEILKSRPSIGAARRRVRPRAPAPRAPPRASSRRRGGCRGARPPPSRARCPRSLVRAGRCAPARRRSRRWPPPGRRGSDRAARRSRPRPPRRPPAHREGPKTRRRPGRRRSGGGIRIGFVQRGDGRPGSSPASRRTRRRRSAPRRSDSFGPFFKMGGRERAGPETGRGEQRLGVERSRSLAFRTRDMDRRNPVVRIADAVEQRLDRREAQPLAFAPRARRGANEGFEPAYRMAIRRRPAVSRASVRIRPRHGAHRKASARQRLRFPHVHQRQRHGAGPVHEVDLGGGVLGDGT